MATDLNWLWLCHRPPIVNSAESASVSASCQQIVTEFWRLMCKSLWNVLQADLQKSINLHCPLPHLQPESKIFHFWQRVKLTVRSWRKHKIIIYFKFSLQTNSMVSSQLGLCGIVKRTSSVSVFTSGSVISNWFLHGRWPAKMSMRTARQM